MTQLASARFEFLAIDFVPSRNKDRTMAKHLSKPMRLHLRRELDMIRGAVDAARILGEAVATSQLGPERDHRQAPRALTSLLSLISERLRDVRRAARHHPVERPQPPTSVSVVWARPTSDEQTLALCAMRQHATGAAHRV